MRAQLSNVSVLFCFFLFLFGILGVNMFAGKLHFRCTEPGSSEWVDDTAVCATSADCEGEQTCEYYEINPADGALSYDNVLYAFVTIFQAVTLEGWVDQMYMLGITTNETTTVIYYIFLVVFGAMFIVQLFLAVMFGARTRRPCACALPLLPRPPFGRATLAHTRWPPPPPPQTPISSRSVWMRRSHLMRSSRPWSPPSRRSKSYPSGSGSST